MADLLVTSEFSVFEGNLSGYLSAGCETHCSSLRSELICFKQDTAVPEFPVFLQPNSSKWTDIESEDNLKRFDSSGRMSC